jgi:hypothetical protein
MRQCFLSHNFADKPFVRRLGADLESRGCRVWLDENEIRVGESLRGRVEQGLNDCDVVLLVWSRAAAQSGWVDAELGAAFIRRVQSQATLIPLRLDDTPLPLIIQDIKYADFRVDYRAALRSLLVALGTALEDPPLDGLERRLLLSIGREGKFQDVRSTWDMSSEEGREETARRRLALEHLVTLELVTESTRQIYAGIDEGVMEYTFHLTDKGRILCEGLEHPRSA